MRIVMMIDSEGLRLMLSQFLAIEWPDVDIIEIATFEEAVSSDKIDWSSFDAALLDESVLGGLDGLRRFHAVPDCPPVIYLIEDGHEAQGITAMEYGAVDYHRRSDIAKAMVVDSVKVAVEQRRKCATLVTQVIDITLPSQETNDPTSSGVEFRFKDTGKNISINGYRILRELGSGGMSTVFLAARRSDNRQVALKILENTLSEDDGQLKRFIQEYGIIAKLSSAHVGQIYDQGFTDDHIYIAMEYFPGGDLKARLGRPLPPLRALTILYQIASALDAIHSHGIIHRDLKPQNVMFRANEQLAIVDFGIAKQISHESSLSLDGQLFGTPSYMSVEQGRGERLDARSDLYSLGVIFHELLTGSKPFKAGSPMMMLMMHQTDPIPMLPSGCRKFQDLLNKLLAKDRDDRFSSAAKVCDYVLSRWSSRKSGTDPDDLKRTVHSGQG